MVVSLHKSQRRGFSLVETIVGAAVMSLVITGGLIALGQATLLSEKSTKQIRADLILRQEVEALRSVTWPQVDLLHETITAYEEANRTERYPILQTYDLSALAALGFEAEVTSNELPSSGQRGRTIFKILLIWNDKSGKAHEESRVLTITEGGFSAAI